MKKAAINSVILSLLLVSCGNAPEEKKEKTEKENKEETTSNEVQEQETETSGFKTVSVAEFETLIQQPCTILDVRTPEETAEGIISGAIEMDINGSEFSNQIQTLDKSKPVCVYCKAGGRSANASEMLLQLGYTVYNLDGGYDAWKMSGK